MNKQLSKFEEKMCRVQYDLNLVGDLNIDPISTENNETKSLTDPQEKLAYELAYRDYIVEQTIKLVTENAENNSEITAIAENALRQEEISVSELLDFNPQNRKQQIAIAKKLWDEIKETQSRLKVAGNISPAFKAKIFGVILTGKVDHTL